jgi:hypothetical protein
MANELNEADVFGKGSNLTTLVDELDELYPLFTPSPKDEDRTIMYRAGQRSVIDYILSKMNNE